LGSVWDIEKIFDESKNKLCETKAWTSPEWHFFKRSLGHFLASTKRCCPKRCGVLYGTPSFQAAGFRRGFIGQGAYARVPLPPGRTDFLAFLSSGLPGAG